MSDKIASPTGSPARPSFDEVYRGSFAYVWRLLGYLGVPESDRDDDAQEVFRVVHRRLPQYEPRDKLRGWLGAIAARVAAKSRTREKNRVETTVADPDAPDESFDLHQEVASAEEVQTVLQDVDPDLCFVFAQHYLFEVSVAQLAQLLGLTDNTVKTRLRLARKAVGAAWRRYKARARRTDQGSNVVPILGPLTFMEAARRIPEAPEAQARVWAAIQAGLDGGGPDGPVSGGPTPSARRLAARGLRAPLASPTGLAAGAITLAVGVGVGAVWGPLDRSIRGTSLAPVSVPSVVASLDVTPAPLPVAVASEAPAPSAAATSSAAPEVDFDNVLVDRAENALRSGQIDRALASAQAHAARFHGGGKRAYDREVVWISALLQAGRRDEARERLGRFEVLYPGNARLDGFRRALASP